MTKLNETTKKCNSDALHRKVEEIIELIGVTVADRVAVHEVERRLWHRATRA